MLKNNSTNDTKASSMYMNPNTPAIPTIVNNIFSIVFVLVLCLMACCLIMTKITIFNNCKQLLLIIFQLFSFTRYK